jgi:hypothetical protein
MPREAAQAVVVVQVNLLVLTPQAALAASRVIARAVRAERLALQVIRAIQDLAIPAVAAVVAAHTRLRLETAEPVEFQVAVAVAAEAP